MLSKYATSVNNFCYVPFPATGTKFSINAITGNISNNIPLDREDPAFAKGYEDVGIIVSVFLFHFKNLQNFSTFFPLPYGNLMVLILIQLGKIASK